MGEERIRNGESAARPEASGVVWLCGAGFLVALLVTFYPSYMVTTDETRYVSAASFFMTGKAFDPASDGWFWKPNADETQLERTFDCQSPLYSVMLVPLVAIGWRSVFVPGVAVHLLAFAGLIYVLRRRGLSPAWALLYLLYPPFVLYSRMVITDVLGASVVVLVLVLLHREKPSWVGAGAALGFLGLLKLSNLPLAAAFCAVIFVQDVYAGVKSGTLLRGLARSRWVRLAVGGLPAVVLLGVQNTYFFNAFLGSPYFGRAEGWFSWANVLEHLPFYAVSLMVMYPFMLISPFFVRAPHAWEMRISCLAVLLFFSAYYFVDPGNSWAEALVRGQRFQLLVMPFYTLAYAEMLTGRADAPLRRKVLRWSLGAGVVVLACAAGAICWMHAKHSAVEGVRARQLAGVLPKNATLVVAESVLKYYNAAERPDLRSFRHVGGDEIVGFPGNVEMPIYLVVAKGDDVRTRAYREVTERERRDLLSAAERAFNVRRLEAEVNGVEIWVLESRRETSSRAPGSIHERVAGGDSRSNAIAAWDVLFRGRWVSPSPEGT
jgi:hypothetical protein